MKHLLIVLFVFLTSCSPNAFLTEDEIKREALQAAIDKQITVNGFALVGKTPDGKPLLMKEVDIGWTVDRVYFTNDTITAKEYCSRYCRRTIITVKP